MEKQLPHLKSFKYPLPLKVKSKIEQESEALSKDRGGVYGAFNLSLAKNKNLLNNKLPNLDADQTRYSIVLEGKSGQTSVAEICRREGIDQDTFLTWTKEFLTSNHRELRLLKHNSTNYNDYLVKVERFASEEVFEYFSHYFDFSKRKVCITNTNESKTIQKKFCKNADHIINFQKLNDFRYINKYFELVNSKLEVDGLFAGCFETFSSRRNRLFVNKIPVLSEVYFGSEFLFKRVLPKVSFTKKIYFEITKGNNRLLSKAEGLGRLVSCGFKIMDFKSIDGLTYFVVKKVSDPCFDMNPSYGPIYKMPRIGKNGKIIKVYKFRTMHPYSEYLQDYIVRAHGYGESGKPANDFRVPQWGKFMRRIWLDEWPQLINVLKGDMKLVGIRPVSKRYFQDIPKEMQKLRLTQKPGCIPPYVALNRAGNVMSVLQAEKDYLIEKIKNPFSTDIKYFLLAVYNIVVKHKRSA